MLELESCELCAPGIMPGWRKGSVPMFGYPKELPLGTPPPGYANGATSAPPPEEGGSPLRMSAPPSPAAAASVGHEHGAGSVRRSTRGGCSRTSQLCLPCVTSSTQQGKGVFQCDIWSIAVGVKLFQRHPPPVFDQTARAKVCTLFAELHASLSVSGVRLAEL